MTPRFNVSRRLSMQSAALLLCVSALLTVTRLLHAQQPADAPPASASLKLFLLVGQSNMAGRGTVEAEDRAPVAHLWMQSQGGAWVPAIEPLHYDKPKVVGVGPGRAFGAAIAAAMPTSEIGLIPAAVGGSSIRAWEPGAADSATSTHPYDDAIVRAKQAMTRGSLAGILWLQGESDGNARNAGDYEARMRAVIANLRRDLKAPDVPFLIGQMGRFSEKPWNAYRERVDSAHRKVAATTPHAAFIVTEGLRHRGDTIHYDAASAREVGRRYAKSFLQMTASGSSLLLGPKPSSVPALRALVGEYSRDGRVVFVIEDSASLVLLDTARATASRVRISPATIRELHLVKRNVGPAEGVSQLKVTPVRSIADIRREALAASPPAEKPPARASDLVELTTLDPSIKLEIRYATTNNFAGTKFYDQARAFMQRPAAEAVVRAHHSLRALGYGLLIHDAYRPWYVTRMFWDAMPVDKRWLVANPIEGSKHNRGAAVDLTLYDLKTGRPIEMPSTYDESTGRAHADYPGGTSLQRWHRALLRDAMVAEGFLVNPLEWWHFDFGSWRDYSIGNITFDKIGK